MPSLRDLLRRNNEPEETAQPTHRVPDTQYTIPAAASWARLQLDPIYDNASVQTVSGRLRSREPEVFNETEDYPEDTPEAIRIRLANLEEIERGLEEERQRNSIYYNDGFMPETPTRVMLRSGDIYNYSMERRSIVADRNMLVNEYQSHSRDINYHPVIIDTEEVSFDGTPYTVRTIRYEPDPITTPPPVRMESIYGVPFISTYDGSTNGSTTNQSPYIDTDVGTVLPSTRYRIEGVRT